MRLKKAVGPLVVIGAAGGIGYLFLANSGILAGPKLLRREQEELRQLGVPITIEEGAKLRLPENDPRNSAPIYERIEQELKLAATPGMRDLTPANLVTKEQLKDFSQKRLVLEPILRRDRETVGRPEFQGSQNFSWQDGSHTRYVSTLTSNALLRSRLDEPMVALEDIKRIQALEERMTRQVNMSMPTSTLHLDATVLGLLSEVVGRHAGDPNVLKAAEQILSTAPKFDLWRSYVLRPSVMEREFNILLDSPPPPYEAASRWYKLGGPPRAALQARYLKSLRQFFKLIPREPTSELGKLTDDLDELVKLQQQEPGDFVYSIVGEALPNWEPLAREVREAHSRRKLASLALRLCRERLNGRLPDKAGTSEEWIDPMDGKPFEYKRTPNGFLLAKADDKLIPPKPKLTPWFSLPHGYEALWEIPNTK